MPAPTTLPPDSVRTEMVKELAQILYDDEDLRSYFGWDVPYTEADTPPASRRIWLDDNGGVDRNHSPKLCLAVFGGHDQDDTLNESVDFSELGIVVALVVYTWFDRSSNGEKEKILCQNLTDAAKRVINQNPVSPSGSWGDLRWEYPSTTYDSGEYFRRSGGTFVLRDFND